MTFLHAVPYPPRGHQRSPGQAIAAAASASILWGPRTSTRSTSARSLPLTSRVGTKERGRQRFESPAARRARPRRVVAPWLCVTAFRRLCSEQPGAAVRRALLHSQERYRASESPSTTPEGAHDAQHHLRDRSRPPGFLPAPVVLRVPRFFVVEKEGTPRHPPDQGRATGGGWPVARRTVGIPDPALPRGRIVTRRDFGGRAGVLPLLPVPIPIPIPIPIAHDDHRALRTTRKRESSSGGRAAPPERQGAPRTQTRRVIPIISIRRRRRVRASTAPGSSPWFLWPGGPEVPPFAHRARSSRACPGSRSRARSAPCPATRT